MIITRFNKLLEMWSASKIELSELNAYSINPGIKNTNVTQLNRLDS